MTRQTRTNHIKLRTSAPHIRAAAFAHQDQQQIELGYGNKAGIEDNDQAPVSESSTQSRTALNEPTHHTAEPVMDMHEHIIHYNPRNHWLQVLEPRTSEPPSNDNDKVC